MPKKRRSSRRSDPSTRLVGRLEALAGNLWWSWSPRARALWDRVAEAAPESRRAVLRRNPVALVRALSSKQLERLAADRELTREVREVEKDLRAYLREPEPPCGLSTKAPVAYFSMEFGLHESLPIYSGGLGILAGDHIKSASDVAVPLVGVTFAYREGYFRQRVDAAGQHDVSYPKNDFSSLPLEPVRDRKGKDVRVRVELPGRSVEVGAWRCRVGRRDLYLLDTDLPSNSRRDRVISYRLYDGDREMRIAQEVVLGIGGARLLEALRIRPGVWHLNEGHVAFLTIERLRHARAAGLDLDSAIESVASNTVFTTHTPVPAGNEMFDLPLAERYLREHCEAAGVPVEQYLRLGLDHDDDGRPWMSLTVLAIRLSRFRNGVSALHGEVSRAMWSKLWPGFGPDETPIGSVTNGIHVPTWIAPEFDRLYRERLGDDWFDRMGDGKFWRGVRKIPDRVIWQTKRELKEKLIAFVRERAAERYRRYGWSEARVRKATESLLDPDALTIGFARRFASYKRATLVFRDLQRAKRLFGSRKTPVQIIFAGKPHPADPEGRRLFEEIEAISRKKGLSDRVVLIENYDTEVCRHMVQGVDVWLNNPRRPQEASGTSGQKVPINCGLNLSILDGWWCEGYDSDVGWAFGKQEDYEDLEAQDRDDHADLFRVLEREVVPAYWRRERSGLPKEWLRRVKASLERLAWRFSTSHMVLDYAQHLYAPALENGQLFHESRDRESKEIAAWARDVGERWPLVHVREVRPARRKSEVEVEVYLGGISPDAIACCDATGDLLEVRGVQSTSSGAEILRVEAPPQGGTVRIFPTDPALVHPQELGLSVTFDA